MGVTAPTVVVGFATAHSLKPPNLTTSLCLLLITLHQDKELHGSLTTRAMPHFQPDLSTERHELSVLVELGKTTCDAYYSFLEVDPPPDIIHSPTDLNRFGSRRFTSNADKRLKYSQTSLKLYAFLCHNNWLDQNKDTILTEGGVTFPKGSSWLRQPASGPPWDDVPEEVRSFFDTYTSRSEALNDRLARLK